MHKKSVKNFHQLLLNFIFLLDFAGNTRTAHSTRAIRRARCIISTRRVSQVEKNNSRTFSHRVSNSYVCVEPRYSSTGAKSTRIKEK